MTRRARTISLLAPLLLPLLAGCSDQSASVCTTIFQALPVTVVDSTGTPVPDATLASVVSRTGDTLRSIPAGNAPNGTYVIADDGDRASLRAGGDTVRVTAGRGAEQAAVNYFIDVPGGCHVHLVSGPDTLMIH
jgi:hypothetical protein